MKCECPEIGKVPKEREHLYSDEEKSGMNHDKYGCRGTNNIRKFRREDKELYLCSCCFLFEDVEIKAPEKKKRGRPRKNESKI